MAAETIRPAATPISAAAARVLDRLAVRANPPLGVEVWPVEDRASWLARRQQDVTASAVGALLGVHEFMSAYALAALKSGRMAEDPEESPQMVRGRLLEPVALQLLAEQRPTWTICQPGRYYRDPVARIGATPDAFARDPDRDGFGIVQVKTVEPSVFRRKWRTEDGAEEPPLWVVVQAITEAHLTGASWAVVVALRVGFGLDLSVIEVPLHAGLIDRIKSEVAAFWRLVDAGQMPDADYGRDGAVIAALNQPDDALPPLDLSADNRAIELADERERQAAAIKEAEAAKKAAEAEIVAKLGGHTTAILADGRKITRKIQHRKESIVKATSFPVLRISSRSAA